MFIKSGQLEIINTVSENNLEEWGPIVKERGKNFILMGEELDKNDFNTRILFEPEKYVYFRARAITADIPNMNGDLFEALQVKSAFPTFTGKPLFIEHNSGDLENRIGKIFASRWVEGKDKAGNPDKYVETLSGVEIMRNPEYADGVKKGAKKTVSMGAIIGHCICSVCGKTYYIPADICVHMSPLSPFFVKAQKFNGQLNMAYPVIASNPIIYEINRDIMFNELSLVEFPADPSAHVFEVWAHLKRSLGMDITKASLYLSVLIEYLKKNTEPYEKLSSQQRSEFDKVLEELKTYFGHKEVKQ